MASLLIILLLLAAAVEAIIVESNYDNVRSYSCWKKGELFFDRGILFKFDDDFLNSWPGNLQFDCHMPIVARTKGMGIISVIQQLKLRKKGDECFDYVQFSDHRTIHCGEMYGGQKLLNNGSISIPPRIVSEFSGPFVQEKYGSLSESLKFVSSGAFILPSWNLGVHIRVQEKSLLHGERLSFSVAFTGFKECDALNVPKGLFNCGYGVCILEIFVADGVVNCPFGDCRDEGNCENDFNLNSGSKNGTGIEGSLLNSTIEFPKADTTFNRWIQNSKGREDHSIAESEIKIAEEMRNFREEFKKHNSFLERISQILGSQIVPENKNTSEI